MKRKYYLVFALIAIMGIIFISGCIQQTPIKGTEELSAKAHLIEKYNPGRCFGMPRQVPDEIVTRTLNQNPDLATFVKNRFGVSEDYDISTRISQLNGVTLTKTDFGYDFIFIDGRCCNIHTFIGKITINGNQITDEITNQSTKGVDC